MDLMTVILLMMARETHRSREMRGRLHQERANKNSYIISFIGIES